MIDWKEKIEAIKRLATDQKGKPEGEVAEAKLLELINKYPEAAQAQEVIDYAKDLFTLKDIADMHRQGTSTDGSWTAPTFEDAIKIMIEDYRQRKAMKQTEDRKQIEGAT